MAPEQTDAALVQAASSEGVFSTPENEDADEFIERFEQDSLHADELINISHDLGQMHEVIEAGAPDAISPAAAEALGVAVEAFLNIAKLPARPVFSMEQFNGGYAQRANARRVALEGITDVIKKVTAKLIKWLRKIMNYLYDTMQELVFGADNILRASQEIQERARAIAHKPIGDGKEQIDDTKLITFFSDNGVPYDADEVLKTYAKHCDDMKKAFSAGFIKEVGLRTHEALAEAAEGESKEATEAKISKILHGMRDKTFHQFQGTGDSGEHHEIAEWVLPFGERRLVLVLNKDPESSDYTGFAISTDKAKSKTSALAERHLETMSYEQIMRTAKAIEHEMLFGLFKSYKSSKSELGRIRNDIEKGCDKIARQQQASSRASSITYSVSFLKDLASALVQALAITHRYDILVARHLLAYCNASIKQHG